MENSEESQSVLEGHSKAIFNAVEKAKRNPETALRLRQQIRQLREDLERSRQSGQDPGELYPADVLKLIFDQLEDLNDLISCSYTCTSFNSIINCSRQELLFGKILPYVIPYFTWSAHYNEQEIWHTLINCSAVCKKWSVALKGLGFPNKCFLGTPPKWRNGGKNYHMYSFENAYPEDRFPNIRNMFLTGLSIDIPEWRTTLPWPDRRGHEIWRLALLFGKNKRYSSRKIYSLCTSGIRKCSNLKALCLRDISNKTTVIDNGINETLTLNSTTLESISIEIRNPNILRVQNELLRRFSAQLKHVKVRYWNSELYQTLPWNNLTELEILEGKTVDVLSFLESSVSAQNWPKLNISLDSSCQDLSNLFRVLNRFPKLKYLGISVKDDFTAWTEKDFVEVPLELLATKCVTSLEISAENLWMARDLALFFPFVKKLVFYYGNPDSKTSETSENINSHPHYIQLPKNMYKSNIWDVLPFLEHLKVEDRCTLKAEYRRFYYKEKRVKEFARRTYNLERNQYILAIYNHILSVHKIVKKQTQERLKRETEILSARLTNPNIIYSHPDIFKVINEDGPLYEQVFHFVIRLLENPDIKACRLVCKSWKEIVGDGILENCKQNIFYKFHLPLATYFQSEQFRQFVQDNKLKPFFARKVEICLSNVSGNTVGLQLILDTLGNYIHHLKISSEKNIDPNICDVYKILRECLKQCVNMKRFSFEIQEIQSNIKSDKYYEKLKASGALTAPPNLEFISTCGRDYVGEREETTELNKILEDLKIATQKTVKVVKQDRCHKGYFPNLRELTSGISELDEINCFYISRRLEKLRLYVIGQNITLISLYGLFRDDYSHTKFLELNFTPSCGGFEFVANGLLPECIFKVTELNVVFQDKSQISVDFLVQFPLVRKLTLTYGKWAYDYENMSKMKGTNTSDYDIPKAQQEHEFIQLVRFFKDEKKKEHETHRIYTSNIWCVLRKMQNLEVVYCGKQGYQEKAFFNRMKAEDLLSKEESAFMYTIHYL